MEVAPAEIGSISRSYLITGCRWTAGFFVQFVGGGASNLTVPIRPSGGRIEHDGLRGY
jgi:hypothetical protein